MALRTFGCRFAPGSAVVRRGWLKARPKQEGDGLDLAQDVERALVKIARRVSDFARFCHRQRVDEKGKRLGKSTQKRAICRTGRLKGWVGILPSREY